MEFAKPLVGYLLNNVISLNEKEGGTEEEEDDDEDEYECYVCECSDELYEPLDNPEEYKDPSITTIKNDQKTPFYLAVEKENLEIIQLLLESDKIDINIVFITKTETK